jgi:hypothetical protein
MAAPQGRLQTANNDCKGKNGCKGKGWVEMLQDECKNHGGQFQTS